MFFITSMKKYILSEHIISFSTKNFHTVTPHIHMRLFQFFLNLLSCVFY